MGRRTLAFDASFAETLYAHPPPGSFTVAGPRRPVMLIPLQLFLLHRPRTGTDHLFKVSYGTTFTGASDVRP